MVAATIRSGTAHDRAVQLSAIISRIDLREAAIDLTIETARLVAGIGMEASVKLPDRLLVLTMLATRIRRGHQVRLVIPGCTTMNQTSPASNAKLVALMAEAHRARQLILASPDRSIAAIAATHGRCRARLGKLATLACLAPDITTAIVEGRQPVTLTAITLQNIYLPLAWPAQRALLGFN